jgi:tripartite-type tricarboxylate transporter receptor subunit TctC
MFENVSFCQPLVAAFHSPGERDLGALSRLPRNRPNCLTIRGIRAAHLPAQPGDAIADVIASLVAGRTTYMMAPIQLALVDIRAGNLRALGVTTKKRSSLLPEVPTISEAGVPGFDHPIWYGVWVPAGTPAGVVEKIAKDIARTLARPDVRDELATHGADPMSMTQPEFARFVLSESESAAHIIETAGIKPH